MARLREEQKRRLLSRLDDPAKNWKFSPTDFKEPLEMEGIQGRLQRRALRGTSTADAPWYVIPADHKWFARLAVAEIVVETLRDLNPSYPEVSKELRRTAAVPEAA